MKRLRKQKVKASKLKGEKMKNSFGYSKKVMAHFKNPKNMGEMKNPDAVGEVGNLACGDVMRVYIKVKDNKIKDIKFQTMGCVPPAERISLGGNWSNISNLSEGDYILDRNCKRTKIEQIYKNNFNGKLIKIIPFVSKFNSFLVTPTHPILCIKRGFLKYARRSSSKCNWLRVKEEELISTKPYYVESNYLEVGDYLIFPKLKKIKDNAIFTKELMKLLGYYLAEGYISPEGVINFALNKNEYENIKEIKKLFKKVIGKPGSERIRRNVIELRVCSRKWARFFVENGGKYAKHKALSEAVLTLPFEKQFEMIKTYIKGDGNIYRRRKRDTPTYRVDTTSERLAIQIQEILARGGIFASIKRFDNPASYLDGRKLPAYTIFNISFKLKKKHRFVKENCYGFLVPIKKIELQPFKGKVYNLETNGKSHSYLVKGFVVHNCIAAIATSSMVTELAKGKTLENAKKITNRDVADSLGSLPPIKMHCSNLAADALKKAIENYEKKQKK